MLSSVCIQLCTVTEAVNITAKLIVLDESVYHILANFIQYSHLEIFRVFSAFCSMLVSQNAKITWKIPSSQYLPARVVSEAWSREHSGQWSETSKQQALMLTAQIMVHG